LIQFVLSLAVFLALHSVPAIPAIRQGLIARLGRRTYLIAYSIASLLALGWVFHAGFQLDYVEIWAPSAWQAWFPLILTPIAFFLLIAGLISPNPTSVTLRRHGDQVGTIVAITRHPVLWGFLLWAFGHIVANGDLRSLILFGVFALFSLFGMVMADRRTKKKADPRAQDVQGSTSILPFAAIVQGRTQLRVDRAMIIALVISAVLTAWMLVGGHAVLFGADPLLMTQI
jgi:uncharacterized membrane protein